MIAWITDNCSRAITGKPAGIPCTDPGYPHPSAMRLMVASFLDIPFSPQMQFLFLSPRYLSFCFQILKHDHIRVVFFRISCNCSCDLSSKFCVKTLRVGPSAFHLCRTMFPLEPAYSSQHTVHPVFFTGKINKLSSQDSSICPHNGTDCIRIES